MIKLRRMMGKACNMNWGEEEYMYNIGWKASWKATTRKK
jgi:hypothetical protein